MLALAPVWAAACFGDGKQPNNINIGNGWYNLERSPDNKNWWIWTKDKGEFVIEPGSEMVLTLRGGVGSIERPNKVNVLINGNAVKTLEVTGDKYEQKPIEPITFTFKQGKNTIEFVSANKAVKIPTDTRELAIAVDNITLTNADGSVKFELPQ